MVHHSLAQLLTDPPLPHYIANFMLSWDLIGGGRVVLVVVVVYFLKPSSPIIAKILLAYVTTHWSVDNLSPFLATLFSSSSSRVEWGMKFCPRITQLQMRILSD